MQYVPWSRSQ